MKEWQRRIAATARAAGDTWTITRDGSIDMKRTETVGAAKKLTSDPTARVW